MVDGNYQRGVIMYRTSCVLGLLVFNLMNLARHLAKQKPLANMRRAHCRGSMESGARDVWSQDRRGADTLRLYQSVLRSTPPVWPCNISFAIMGQSRRLWPNGRVVTAPLGRSNQ